MQRQTKCDACVPEAEVGECSPQTNEKTRKAGAAAPVHPVDTSTEQWQDIKVSCITLV